MVEINYTQVQRLRLTKVEGLDPINVIFDDFSPGCGKVTVDCYGSAWCCMFESMGGQTIRQFVASSDPHYLTTKLLPGVCSNSRQQWLLSIVRAVQQAAAISPPTNKES